MRGKSESERGGKRRIFENQVFIYLYLLNENVRFKTNCCFLLEIISQFTGFDRVQSYGVYTSHTHTHTCGEMLMREFMLIKNKHDAMGRTKIA